MSSFFVKALQYVAIALALTVVLGNLPARAFSLNELPVVISHIKYIGKVVVLRHTVNGQETLTVHAFAGGISDKTSYPARTHDVGTPGFPQLISQVFSYASQECLGTGAFDRLSPGDVEHVVVNLKTVRGPVITVPCP